MTNFCPRCGARLSGPPPCRCGACDYAMYVNARPTGSVVILDGSGTRFLAIRRARQPNAGKWDLPGGFCEGREHPASAAVREAREEVGVTVRLGPLIGLYVGSYEFQQEDLPVLDCFYVAWITAGDVVLDPAEASGYAWLPVADPPRFAFATMDAALRDLNVMFQEFVQGTSVNLVHPGV